MHSFNIPIRLRGVDADLIREKSGEIKVISYPCVRMGTAWWDVRSKKTVCHDPDNRGEDLELSEWQCIDGRVRQHVEQTLQVKGREQQSWPLPYNDGSAFNWSRLLPVGIVMAFVVGFMLYRGHVERAIRAEYLKQFSSVVTGNR